MLSNHSNPVITLLHTIQHTLRRMEQRCAATHETVVGFIYTVEIRNKKRAKDSPMPLNVTLNNEQQLNLSLSPASAHGTPESLDGDPTFTSDNADTVISYDASSKQAVISPPSNFAGVVTVTVSADAKIGDGVDTIQDTVVLTVVNPEATTLGLSGEVSEKPVVDPLPPPGNPIPPPPPPAPVGQ